VYRLYLIFHISYFDVGTATRNTNRRRELDK